MGKLLCGPFAGCMTMGIILHTQQLHAGAGQTGEVSATEDNTHLLSAEHDLRHGNRQPPANAPCRPAVWLHMRTK